ncbi:integrase core domain-containing protein [Streptomyces chiangmaiensis]|uniref:Integrase core domain-containing protein n=1 Tax=Streptomyces chiangmaiensis TaxID=766497 RepID=A0ABU7FPX4_9ACTN|nr:integrase core domain-containing protein [Streptomyces chiangmaiensis]MED7826048.1 integrase core domain-containing protein [Streptomyces chiangmaiensis]
MGCRAVPATFGRKPGRSWNTLSQVELATAEWADWYCHRRLHGGTGHVPPVEYEATVTWNPPHVTHLTRLLS